MSDMMQPTQVEAHINRLTAVRDGLQKYADRDGRATETVAVIQTAINILETEPFSPPTVSEDPDPSGEGFVRGDPSEDPSQFGDPSEYPALDGPFNVSRDPVDPAEVTPPSTGNGWS